MINTVLSGTATHHVACERAESFINRLPDGCVSLMTLDFPYFGVKDDAWDNAWPTPEAFIAWMGGVLAQCRRALAPNGSIYVFAAPQVRGGLTMATRVECEVARHFSVLSRITWIKSEGTHRRQNKVECRAYFPQTEALIFAEHQDAMGFMRRARLAAGMTAKEATAAAGAHGAVNHGGAVSNWEQGLNAPSREQYERLAVACPLPPYERAIRHFSVSAEVPYTDVWTYRTVNTYAGKHPCEKPEDMARNMVRASSRPGDVVADFFCGSGAFLAAAVAEGRRAIGCDMDPHWAEQAQRRCDAVKATGRVVRTAPKPKDDGQIDIFSGRSA